MTNVQAADAGTYSVVVSNSAGNVTSANATLTVSPAAVGPAITTQPASQSVTAGSDVTFSVTATGTAPLTYQWRKGGSNISGATSATYSMTNVQAADAGTYSVVVSNSAGNVTSANATLAVSPAAVAPVITTQPASQSVIAGSGVTFSVTATGTAPLTYQWRKGGSNISGATSATYSMTNVQAADAGTYSVVVSNSAGSVTSANATLTVSPAAVGPAITTQPASQSVTAGSGVTFSVTATGTAPLSYQWRKGGSNISGATSASLLLSNVQTNQDGNYAVVIANAAGSVTSADAVLSVQPVPSMKGTYNGLFYEAAGVRQESAGFITMTVADTGRFRGRLQVAGGRYSFGGQFDASGKTTVTLLRSGKSALTVELQLDLADGTDQIMGRVSVGVWEALVLGDRAVYDVRANPAPYSGTYSVEFDAAAGAVQAAGSATPSAPAALAKVNGNGEVRVRGRLPDGTVFKQKVSTSKNGAWPFYAPLCRGQGSLIGWITITDEPAASITGELIWTKPDRSTETILVQGAPYTSPAK